MLPGSMSGLSKAMVMQLRKMKTRTTWSNILCAMTFWQETRSLRRQPRSEDPKQTRCLVTLREGTCLAVGGLVWAHSTFPVGCSLSGCCWVEASSPVLRWEEVQGPGLPAAAPLRRVGFQHFV